MLKITFEFQMPQKYQVDFCDIQKQLLELNWVKIRLNAAVLLSKQAQQPDLVLYVIMHGVTAELSVIAGSGVSAPWQCVGMLSVRRRTQTHASIVGSTDCEGMCEHTKMPLLVELGQSRSRPHVQSVSFDQFC